MDKQLLKAFALSIAILLGWQLFMSWYSPAQPEQPVATPEIAQAPAPQPEGQPAPAPATQPAAPAAAATAVATTAEPPRDVVVATSKWRATFSNKGGVATSWVLVEGPDGKPIVSDDNSALELVSKQGLTEIGAPFRLSTPGDDELARRLNETTAKVTAKRADGSDASLDAQLEVKDGETLDLAFAIADPASNQVVTKRFTFTGGRYDAAVTLETTGASRPFSIVLGPRIGDQSVKTEGSYSHTPSHAVVGDDADKIHYVNGGDVKEPLHAVEGNPRWVGITDNYFGMTAASPDSHLGSAIVTNAKLKFAETDEKTHDFVSVALPVPTGKAIPLFVGPKDPDLLDQMSVETATAVGAHVDYGRLINYGWFSFLVKPIIPIINWALTWTNRLTHNYGWSIIIVTTLFNLLFFPLRYKSSVAMKRTAKLQPRMKELQAKMKKYKSTDPQFKELQMEQMALMKEGNPLGGCLPMLVQFPFFWAFFIYFTTTFVVRKQPWMLWVKDLTSPDPYYILPVLMCAAQIGSMLITPMPNSDDPAMKMQRRLMTWVMPIAFTYFFLVAAPSGLVLYWMTLNLVGIGVQFAINKMLPPDVKDMTPNSASKKDKKKGPPAAELVASEK